MSKLLVHVADRAAGWSVAADRLKATQQRARRLVLALSVMGALAAALSSQIPEGDAVFSGFHRSVATAAAVLLGLAAIVSSRFLGPAKSSAWVKARAASEALKREAFRFAAGAEPYQSENPAQREQLLDLAREKIESAAETAARSIDHPDRKGSSPRVCLSHDEYRQCRLLAQANDYYRPRAQAAAKTARNLRRIEFGLALAAALATAYTAAMGKTVVGAGIAFDLAALSAVLTTISGATLAHIEASRLDHLVETYRAAARRLEDHDLHFGDASASSETWSRFVNKCEDIIAAENACWVVKWSVDKS